MLHGQGNITALRRVLFFTDTFLKQQTHLDTHKNYTPRTPIIKLCHQWARGIYERASAASERSLFNITEKSQYERSGPTRPETLLRGLYLSNHDRFTRGLLYRVTSSLLPNIELFRYMWVTPNARVTCKNEVVLVF